MGIYDEYKSKSGSFTSAPTPQPKPTAQTEGIFKRITRAVLPKKLEDKIVGPKKTPVIPTQEPAPTGSLYSQYQAKQGVFKGADQTTTKPFSSRQENGITPTPTPRATPSVTPTPGATPGLYQQFQENNNTLPAAEEDGDNFAQTIAKKGLSLAGPALKYVLDKAGKISNYYNELNFENENRMRETMGSFYKQRNLPVPDRYKPYTTKEEYQENKPLIKALNTPTARKIITTVGRESSGSSILARIKSVGDDTYKEAYDRYTKAAENPDNPEWKKFLINVGNTGPQTAIGVMLSIGVTAATRSPITGTVVSSTYFGSLSADEQLREKGKIDSLLNIGIDTVGDQLLGKTIEGLFKAPAKTLVKSMVQAFGVEGGTEVSQTLLKLSNDYSNATTDEQRQDIIDKAKGYVLSGDMVQEFAVGGVIGSGVAAGGVGVSRLGGSSVDTSELAGGSTEEKIEPPKEGEFKVQEKFGDKPAEEVITQLQKDIQDYRTTGISYPGESQPLSAPLIRLAEFSNLPAVQEKTRSDIEKAIQSKELPVNDDGTITIFRAGPVPEDNRLTSVAFTREAAEAFAENSVSQGRALDIAEMRVQPGQIKIFIGRGEKELLLRAEDLRTALSKTPEERLVAMLPKDQIIQSLKTTFPGDTTKNLSDLNSKNYNLETVSADSIDDSQWVGGLKYSPDSRKKIDEFKAQILAGKPIPPVILNEVGGMYDGHHRLQAIKELGIKNVPVIREVKGKGTGLIFEKTQPIQADEIKRVASNLLKNNPGLSKTDAEAMAKDVIEGRKFEPTQKEKVKAAIKEGPKTIKEIAEETKILEPNVRRILGVGAKEGTFERVEKGVYILSKDGQDLAYIHTGDAVETLPKLAKEGLKADMVFLDIPYKTPAVVGGNRGIKYDYITPEQFKTIVDSVDKIVRNNDSPVFYMYSQARSGLKEMQKYTDIILEKFKPVARGGYTKLQMDGVTQVRNMRGDVVEPEGILMLNKTGEFTTTDNFDVIDKNLNFKMVRPKGYQTEKPAELLKALIEMSTSEGETVFDPFAGSGVTPAEAVKAGRKAVAIEKNPQVVEEVIKPRVRKALEALPTKEPTKKREGLKKAEPLAVEAEEEELGFSPRKPQPTEEDYRGLHEAPTRSDDAAAPIYDLTKIYPDDIYGPNAVRYYSAGESYDAESISILQSLRNKPNATVTVYRAIPGQKTIAEMIAELEAQKAYIQRTGKIPKNPITDKFTHRSDYYDFISNEIERLKGMSEPKVTRHEINPGDWVTVNRKYAVDHGESNLGGNYKILKKTVRADELFTDANSIHEFGYDPRVTEEKETGAELGFNPKNLTDPHNNEVVDNELDKLIKREDIMKTLSEKLGVPIRRGKFNRSALGIFKTGPKVVRLKGKGQSGGIPTVFHEVGHFIDDQLKFSQEIDITERKALMVEYGYTYEGQAKKQQKEAFAEFLRFRMTGQTDRTNTLAPVFTSYFEKRLAGLPELKQIIDTAANDYARWKQQPASAKVMSQIGIGAEDTKPLKDRLTVGAHELYTLTIDDLHPIGEFSKLAKRVGLNLPAAQDPYKLARTLRGWIGRADMFLKQGTFGKEYYTEENGKIVPKYKGISFEDIVRPIDEAGNLNDFRIYLVAQRAIELSGRKINTGIAFGDAKEAVREQLEKHPEFELASEALYTYQNQVAEYAYEHGAISTEGLSAMQKLNKFRVPFYRIMEEQATGKFMGKTIGNRGNVFKKIKGSDREIIDPIESIIKDTYAIINAADRNAIGVAMVKAASEHSELGRLFEKVDKPMTGTTVNVKEVLEKAISPLIQVTKADELDALLEAIETDIVTIFKPSFKSTRPGDITVILDGKPQVFHTDVELFKAMQGLEVEDVGMVMRLMSYPAQFLRAGATLTPEFIGRNPLRDQFSAAVFSEHGFIPGVDLFRGMFEIFTDSDTYQLWKMSGGENSTMVSTDRPGTQQTLRELLATKGQKTLSYVVNPLKTLQVMSGFMEQATRLGEMRRALANTKDPREAAFASREVTLDFWRIGAKTRALNAITAFWNANVQGADKLIRSFKDRPRQSLFKSTIYLTLPSILLYLVNRDDGRWEEIPQWQKNIFWIIPTGFISKEDWANLTPAEKVKFMDDTSIIRIPKPFVLGTIFGSIPERLLEHIDTQKPGLFDELMKSLGDGAFPGFIPTGLLPIIENMTNHSFFLDRAIVPQSKTDLPPGQQFSTYTSETSKILGEQLGYSPAKIDNLIRGYFAGLGGYGVSILDKVLEGTGIVHHAPRPSLGLSDRAFVKAFVVRDPIGSGSESVNDFYEVYGRADAGDKYAKQLLESGKIEEAKQYLEEHPEIQYAKAFRQMASIFSEITKAKDAIMKSETMTPDEKREKIRLLEATQTDLAFKMLTVTLKKTP